MVLRTILLIINVILVLSVVFTEHKNPNEALMWVIILTFFPVGGILLYLVFGSTIGIKFNRLVRERKIHSQYQMCIRDSSSTKLVLSHFSHNGKLLHEELVKQAGKFGADVSFDGMTLYI